jgi:hypothetical protein
MRKGVAARRIGGGGLGKLVELAYALIYVLAGCVTRETGGANQRWRPYLTMIAEIGIFFARSRH